MFGPDVALVIPAEGVSADKTVEHSSGASLNALHSAVLIASGERPAFS